VKIINDTEEDRIYIDTGITDLDDEAITIDRLDGYGGCDVAINHSMMTWDQLDKLKQAIKLAEKEWRPLVKPDTPIEIMRPSTPMLYNVHRRDKFTIHGAVKLEDGKIAFLSFQYAKSSDGYDLWRVHGYDDPSFARFHLHGYRKRFSPVMESPECLLDAINIDAPLEFYELANELMPTGISQFKLRADNKCGFYDGHFDHAVERPSAQ